MHEPDYPGAVPPERTWTFESFGLSLNVVEWGDPQAQPLVLTHGMWDHARSFAVFAPLLARRLRVVAVDARGHGDSQWAGNYSWLTDVLDIVNLLRTLGKPVFLLGHSKGGGQATEATRVVSELVRKLINIDGFGPPGPDDLRPAPFGMADYLDWRRQPRETWRAYPTIDDLVARRCEQNPRLTRDWLRYFVYHGARAVDGGWCWKSDPYMARGFGPWRPEWIAPTYATIQVPVLAIIGSQDDTWGPLPSHILEERLSRVRQLERVTINGAGHFVHIEKPAETAAAVLDFLGS